MLDERHHGAYAAARTNLAALTRSTDDTNPAWVRYVDLMTALEQLHAPEDLAEAGDAGAGPRAGYYQATRRALEELRDGGYVDALEVGLLIGNLDQVWEGDPQADDLGARS
ncbi:hypothetical protein AB6N23_01945 [Cellulomonas sp. 179-A 9B4 NHS]|uniref:hypothetical protein n=1 Tax=Cellulomonas sp. 179-A 9B4 NHS TaxID=3142379 RepID=UPI0039A2D03C